MIKQMLAFFVPQVNLTCSGKKFVFDTNSKSLKINTLETITGTQLKFVLVDSREACSFISCLKFRTNSHNQNATALSLIT